MLCRTVAARPACDRNGGSMLPTSPALPGHLKIRLANSDDREQVIVIMAQSVAWLVSKGIDQWPSPPNAPWRRIAGQIEGGEIYLAFTSNTASTSDVAFAANTVGAAEEAIGTLRITWGDPYWPEEVDRAGYVHALALADPYHGLGLGEVLLTWAMAHIAGHGRPVARLDCAAGNKPLCDYYERLDFTFCRQIIDRDFVAALYERKL